MPLVIETARLLLRPFEDRDVEPFSRYRSDPQVARYQSWEAPYSLAQAAGFVDALKYMIPGLPGEWYQLAVEQKTASRPGPLIGDVGFTVLIEDLPPDTAPQGEIGFTLDRAYQGQGYATEAVRAVLGYLFGELKLHRVRANCDIDNPASARVLARAGMRHEGRMIESLWFKGRWVGEDWYAILRREWEAKP
jgi:RimJ/RimL family protein N-acetyltransferase